jgi:RNA polymerase subunit RPABC4/transcription elongation factor Spt4
MVECKQCKEMVPVEQIIIGYCQSCRVKNDWQQMVQFGTE